MASSARIAAGGSAGEAVGEAVAMAAVVGDGAATVPAAVVAGCIDGVTADPHPASRNIASTDAMRFIG
jgi:hypothetical protein